MIGYFGQEKIKFTIMVVLMSIGELSHIIQIDIIKHIQNLKKNNFTIIGADITGKNLYNWNPPEKWAIILGNEAHGISDKIRKFIDYNVTIPKDGNIESLNVSMAGGILLSHINRNIKD